MIKFRQFIAEGGNLKIGNTTADRLKITSKNRAQVKHDIHGALSAIHDSFHKEHGEHLFGKDKKGLTNGSAFSGSTKHLFNSKISDHEFAHHKKSLGDVDVQVPGQHRDALEKHLQPGKKFGKYTVAGMKRGGQESHVIMKHENGEHHQFDFEHVEYKNHEPTKGDQFLHSSDWHDNKAGISGMHHKVLINAAGGEKHKFTPTGIKSRTDEKDKGSKDPTEFSKRLFGHDADHSKIHSFHGTAELIKKHIPKSEHQAIYDKFKSSVASKKHADNTHAIAHLKKVLGTHDDAKKATIKEAHEEVHHASVIPLVGFSPISHMGHAHDLGGALAKLPGKKHVGISSKADLFEPKERLSILHKQWGHGKETRFSLANSAGETVAKAFHDLPAHGKKHLHLLVGKDREDFAKGLKHSLERGDVKEMGDHRWDKIHIHFPEGEDRYHGMSGTKMREAAANDDLKTFHHHMGPMFSEKEAHSAMKKIGNAIKTRQLKVKRPK
jgi:hypothetical protein